jgi:hypothetical protein
MRKLLTHISKYKQIKEIYFRVNLLNKLKEKLKKNKNFLLEFSLRT